jgi:hypothetical protein
MRGDPSPAGDSDAGVAATEVWHDAGIAESRLAVNRALAPN